MVELPHKNSKKLAVKERIECNLDALKLGNQTGLRWSKRKQTAFDEFLTVTPCSAMAEASGARRRMT